jgi:hypothetical protein
MDLQFHHERMNDQFEKWHILGLPFECAIHHFTGPDQGDPHDHPFNFTSHILAGGYTEEVFSPTGAAALVYRHPGTAHQVRATHIHRIIDLPLGDCWTLILAGPHERETRFWRFSDGIQSRAWHESDWTRHDIISDLAA